MKKGIFLISLLLLADVLSAQDSTDSLEQVLKEHPQEDSIRFRLLIDLSDQLISDPSESKRYLDQALDLATGLKLEKYVAEAYCSLAYYYWDRTDYAQAIDHGLKALGIY